MYPQTGTNNDGEFKTRVFSSEMLAFFIWGTHFWFEKPYAKFWKNSGVTLVFIAQAAIKIIANRATIHP
jgi:hypothetical protein